MISHDHYDHLDKTAISKLAETGTPIFVPLGVGAHLELNGWLDLNAEARLMVAWLRVDVAGGRASFTNLAAHLLLGPRVRF